MKVFLTKKKTTSGTKVVVIETKAARTVQIESLNPEFKKERFNLLLCKNFPTRVINGVEVLAL